MSSLSDERRRKRRRVADEDRKRTARACDPCKARKSKCEEASAGICRRCLQQSLPCVNTDSTSPQSVYNAARFEGPPTRPVEQSGISSGGRASSTRASSVRPTAVTSSHDQSLGDFLSRLRQAFFLEPEDSSRPQHVNESNSEGTTPRLSTAELARLRNAVNALPPRDIGNLLITSHIKHGTDSFFFFDQAAFLADFDHLYDHRNSDSGLDASFVCLALASLALGSQWVTLELSRPRHSNDTEAHKNDVPGKMLYDQAKSLVPDLIDNPSVQAVQALYVLGVYLMPISATNSSSMYMGMALRMAFSLNLHSDNSHDVTLNAKEKELRRRLWWSIYSLERCTTIKLNRPRTVNANVITTPLPGPLPELDDLQKYDNHQHQLAYAQLLQIVDRMVDSYDPPTRSDTGEARTNNHAVALKRWKSTLPARFTLASINPRDSSYRAVFHLYLQYYQAWIAAGKVSLVTLVRSLLRGSQEQQPPALWAQAMRCTKSATRMLELFQSIKQTHNLVRFSFTDFHGCSIATIVILLSGILEPDSSYGGQIAFGLECLKGMAVGHAAGEMGLRFVEALHAIAIEAAEKLGRSRSNVTSPYPSTAPERSAEYDRWAQWLEEVNTGQESGLNGTDSGRTHTSVDTTQMPLSVPSQPHPSTNITYDTLAPPPEYQTLFNGASTDPFSQPSDLYGAFQSVQGQQSGLRDDDNPLLAGLTGFDVLDFQGFGDY